jgi:hypothetical protein
VITKQLVEPFFMEPAHIEGPIRIEKTVMRPQGKAAKAEVAVDGPLERVRL